MNTQTHSCVCMSCRTHLQCMAFYGAFPPASPLFFGCGNQISLTFCSIFIQLSTKNSFGIKSEIDCSESCCYHKNGIRKGVVKLEKFHRKIHFSTSCIDGRQGIIINNINFKQDKVEVYSLILMRFVVYP